MKLQLYFLLLLMFITCSVTNAFAAGLENRPIKITSNDRFNFVNNSSIQFKFKPLSDEARALEITKNASSLGVTYLGQVQLKENVTALSALRSIADQIGDSLNISFGVIADSNTSEALKSNELLLLYHPAITITLALARPNEESTYEVICTYALKEIKQPKSKQTTAKEKPTAVVTEESKEPKQTPQKEVVAE